MALEQTALQWSGLLSAWVKISKGGEETAKCTSIPLEGILGLKLDKYQAYLVQFFQIKLWPLLRKFWILVNSFPVFFSLKDMQYCWQEPFFKLHVEAKKSGELVQLKLTCFRSRWRAYSLKDILQMPPFQDH